MCEKSIKGQSVMEWCKCKKCGGMDTNAECLSCGKIEAFGYFPLSGMGYDDRNMASKRNRTTNLQLYLSLTSAKILEQLIEFQRWI